MRVLLKKRLLPLVLAALVLLALAGCGKEVDTAGADVQPSESWYVTDKAGALSAQTENYVLAVCDDLYRNVEQCDLVVVTVEYTGSKTTEQFAYDLFNAWQIGDAKPNHGVLLLLVTGAEDYWCVQGAGLETQLPTTSIQRILNEALEPSFAVGDYDAGVQKTVAALYDELAMAFGSSRRASQVQVDAGTVVNRPLPDTRPVQSGGIGFGGMLSGMFYLILLVAALVVLVVLSALLRPRWRASRWYRPRPPRPPRYYGPRYGAPPPPPPGGFGGPRPPRPPRAPRPPRSGGFTGGAGRKSGSSRPGGIGRSSGGGGFTRGGGAGRKH